VALFRRGSTVRAARADDARRERAATAVEVEVFIVLVGGWVREGRCVVRVS
jgi:hypothetical protein